MGSVPHTKSAKTLIQDSQLFLTGMLLQSIVAQNDNSAGSKGATLKLRTKELLAILSVFQPYSSGLVYSGDHHPRQLQGLFKPAYLKSDFYS